MSEADRFLGIQRIAIVDATGVPGHYTPLDHYRFDEHGTWGYCPHCRFVVTVAEDGRMLAHERLAGAFAKRWCEGDGQPPDIYYRSEQQEEGADDDTAPSGDDHPDAD
ncbi:hypothetical protein ACWD2L_06100 [Streptomyces sp. NPDC002754]